MEASTTACSSPNSVPESDDGTMDSHPPQVQRALDIYNNSKISSRDTPPPPERKSRSKASTNSNDVNSTSSSSSKAETTNNEGGRRRFQFYVPTEGKTPNTDTHSHKETERRGTDPPEQLTASPTSASTAEEAAQKVRSRLIRLQNHHRDLRDEGKYNLRRSAGADGPRGDGMAVETEPRRSQSEVLGYCEFDSPRSYGKFQEEEEEEEEDAERERGTPVEQYQEVDDEDDDDDEDDFPNVNMDPIESDDEDGGKSNYYGSAPNSPIPSSNDDNLILNYPSSAPVDTTRRGSLQVMRQRLFGRGVGGHIKPPFPCGDRPQKPNTNQSSKLKLPFGRDGKSKQSDTQPPPSGGSSAHPLLSDGINILEKAAKQARGRDEMETLNGSINYLRNLQIGVDRRQQEPTDPPPSPPQLLVRTNRPPPNAPQDEEYQLERYDAGRSHRPLPSPRKLGANPSADHIKKGRFLTAAEAMNYVMNASNRGSEYAGGAEGESINQVAAHINEAYSYLNSLARDEVPEYGNTGGAGRTTKTMGSFDSDHDDSIMEDDDDFERNTSLRMHAEEKFGVGSSIVAASKHAEAKQGQHEHRRRAASGSGDYDDSSSISISISGRESDDLARQLKAFHLDSAQSRTIDHHASDSHLFRGSRRKPTIDPPDSEDYLKGSLTSPSVLEKNTANKNLYAVETVISSSYMENHDRNNGNTLGYTSASFDTELPRRRSSDYAMPTVGSHALGPRNKKPGGITGVNLEEYTSIHQQFHNESSDQGFTSGSSSDHEDASVTSSLRSAHENSIAEEAAYSSPREFVGEVDAQSTSLMTMLCGHLLPLGLDDSVQYADSFCGMSSLFVQNSQTQKPTWNDDDPDEPGYVVHRLTNTELNSVELAFEKMITAYGESAAMSSYDNNFERDLKEAEMVLDEEEKRYQAEIKGLPLAHNHSRDSEIDSHDSGVKAHYGSSHGGSSPGGRDSIDDAGSRSALSHNDTEIRECVPDFPGIFPPGKGKPGEMECFYLPIITKSQKTGFEPTKDLVLKPGSVFANNYLVQGELGSAAFSTAYRCVDLSSEEDEDGFQEEVCLKVIKNTKDYFDQSLDEIKILRMLKDTGKVQENNIVEMKSFFYHREHLVIVTELLRQNMYEFGKSIIESRGPPYFTRQRLSHITRQCLIALKFVHELGLMHCDIKPENILLRSYSRALVKVIDFGSSSFVSDRQSSYIQSRSYRAPEVILGLPYDGKIDMWSLGCVVAEMYTGEVTFQNDSEVSMLSRIEAICGPFPKHMIAKGRNSHRIFTDSGLIYEKVSRDDDNESRAGSADSANDPTSTLYHIYQPKMTTMAARLGFEPDFMERPRQSEDDEKRALFIDFVSKLLTIDPDLRPTAKEALKHPWILSSLDLTEDEIRYPPAG
ncbi:hypothetical protein HJC23_008418 [Cyclotella cryptica]|uniref:Protein kinase domain-containing protein n=1 Tax=Cyclotella cryptica TaxID=29204 RepID=A0ABD3PYS4_9STRA|eukprot:CCRYP_010712-RB/>CCRYP_010712-RB protein AED:0.22 eAED:0.22 QI:0/1/0.8/1/0.5/0.4/5/618/1392